MKECTYVLKHVRMYVCMAVCMYTHINVYVLCSKKVGKFGKLQQFLKIFYQF